MPGTPHAPVPEVACGTRVARAAFVGALLGGGLAVGLLACTDGSGPEERVVKRPLATEAEIATWTADQARRGKPLEVLPDPPGDGPVVSEKYWVSLPAYDMEVRRRGPRLTLAIHGVDVQTAGGGWTAFAEGTVAAPGEGFAGAEARIVWSCVGLRHRACTDGVAKLVWSADGRSLVAIYLQANEALHDEAEGGVLRRGADVADTYVKAYGRIARGERPAYGVILGQIPWSSRLPRHDDEERVVVRGVVRSLGGGPVADALVQLKGRDRTRVHADEDGRFEISFLGAEAPRTQSICAGAAGYRNGETVLFTGDPTERVVVELAPLDATDHRDYRWVHPAPDHDPDDAQACGTCHAWQYTEWLGSRHARSAANGHVVAERQRMLRAAPGAPDDCAARHQPAWAAQSGRGEYVPRGVLAGNHCDFCHKVHRVADVRAAGVFGSLELSRPDPARLDRPGDVHRVFGPAADVSYAYMGASWNPVMSSSWLCGGCHQGGGLPGRPKVDTFEEWRAWAAGREDDSFRSCQDCHMPGAATRSVDGTAVDLFAWETLHRPPAAVHSHAFAGTSPSFARPSIDLAVAKRFDAAAGLWRVDVTMKNVGAGHRIPTGTWTKHVALGVWARQGDRWLAAGPDVPRARLLPEGTPGAEALASGDWRDPPGFVLGVFSKSKPTIFATFYDPPAPDDVLDTRLLPGEARTLAATFRPAGEAPGPEPVVVVRVVHRRGPLGAGVAGTPWDLEPYDAWPEVEWARIER